LEKDLCQNGDSSSWTGEDATYVDIGAVLPAVKGRLVAVQELEAQIALASADLPMGR
jgi:hypothetical protein